MFLLRHPDHIKDVLVTHQHSFAKGKGIQWAKLFLGEGLLTSEGEFHTRQRRLAQPAFHRQRIATYGEAMTAHALRCRERLSDGQELDIHAEMMSLTLGVAAKTLFDADVQTEAPEIAESLGVIIGFFPRFALPFASVLHKLPLPGNARFDRAVALLDRIVYRIIAERRASGEDRGDLLSMLLVADDVEGDGTGMTDRQLRDEVMTILLAGHETTANALTWTWYLIAQNPDVEARLHAEIDGALGGRAPTAGDLPALGYVERVFAEAMRLYPPAWGLGRRALKDHRDRGLHDPRRHAGGHEPIRRPARCPLVAGAHPVRPRAVHPRGKGRAAAVRLLPLRGRGPPVHRGVVRLDGGSASAVDHRPAVAVPARARPARGAAGAHHAAPEARHPDGGRGAVAAA